MLLHLFCWAVVGVPCILLGIFVQQLSRPAPTAPGADRVIVALYLGLVLLSTGLLALSLLVPLSPIVLAIISLCILARTLSHEGTLKECAHLFSLMDRRILAGLAALVAIAAFSAADPVKVYDTGAYHYPLTRWLATTGTVPGLALLYGNFGYTSSWFALTAALDHGAFRGRLAGAFNGLVALVAIVHFSLALSRIIRRRASKPDLFLMGAYPVVFALCYQLNYHTSLSPDLPVFVLTIVIAWQILSEQSHSEQLDSFRSNLPLLLMAGGIVDLKLSSLPILTAVLLLIAVRCHFRWRPIAAAALTGSAMAVPFVVVNLVTSGYPLYPSPIFGLSFPWTLSKAFLKDIATVITNWARCNGTCLHDPVGWSWVLPWLRAPQNAVLLLISAMAVIIFVLKRAWRLGAEVIWVLAVAELGVVYVLVTVPNGRFAAGYMSVCLGLSLALLTRQHVEPGRCRRSYAHSALVLALGLELSFVAKPYMFGAGYSGEAQLLAPALLPSHTKDLVYVRTQHTLREVPLMLAAETATSFGYVRPVGGEQCWAAEIPCLPNGLKPGVVLRDPKLGLRGGFSREGSPGAVSND